MDASDAADYLTEPEDQYYVEEVTPELQEGYTTRSDEAADEAEPYLAPTDPPVIRSSNQGAEIATGFGTSPEDAPFRDDVHGRDAWIQAEVERVLREDSATSKLPIRVRVSDRVVFLQGFVSDVDDIEMAESVAAAVPGVESVEDQTEVNPEVVDHAMGDFLPSEEAT